MTLISNRLRFFTISTVTIAFALLTMMTGNATAATFVVDTMTDSGGLTACTDAADDCSLRGAITAANMTAADDTITVPAGTFTLTGAAGDDANVSGDLDITAGGGDLTINGAGVGSTYIGDNTADRAFDVLGGTVASFTDLTIRNSGEAAALSGGGIQVTGGSALTLNRTTVTNNNAAGGGYGGGICVGATSALTVINSTISGNQANGGAGGVFVAAGATFDLQHSTLSSNFSNGGGGGIANDGTATIQNSTLHANQSDGDGGGIYNGGSTTLINATVDANTSDYDGTAGGSGAAIFQTGGAPTTAVSNTLLLDNLSNTTLEGCNITSGTFSTTGINHSDTSSCPWGAADLVDSSANAGTYGDFGGPTLITPISLESPAFNGGDAAVCAASTDQRGAPRTVGTTCDIGAMELGGFQDVGISLTNPTGNATVGGSGVNITGSWSNNSTTDPAVNPQLVFSIPAGLTVTAYTISGGGTCVAGSGSYTCTRDNLNTGETVAITLTVTVSSASSFSVTGAVTAGGTDTSTTNNSASATVTGTTSTSTGTGTTTGTGGTGTTSATPTATLPDLKKTIRVKKGKFSFRVGCPDGVSGDACSVSLRFMTKRKFGKSKISFTCTDAGIAEGTTKTLKCTISRKLLKRLKKARAAVAINVTVTSTAVGGGDPATGSGSFKLKFK